jgi:hypothetical protein
VRLFGWRGGKGTRVPQCVSLIEQPHWVVSPTKDLASFLRSLPSICPEGAILCIEGGVHTHKLKEYLRGIAIERTVFFELGTCWPRPRCYHVPITSQTSQELAGFADHCAAMEIASHIHVYSDIQLLIQWFDICSDSCIFFHESIEEAILASLCCGLKLDYRRIPGPDS